MTYDLIVVGAGHAGCEAALAASRMGFTTLLLTLNLDAVALMPCNPSIGGTAKGHLVREVDALGGEMGLAIDDTFIQSRMLNTAKGPAVHSLRAQADKRAYQRRMLSALMAEPKLTLRQGEVREILVREGRAAGITTMTGQTLEAGAVLIATGVYLKSRIIIGDHSWSGGPQGLLGATALSDSLTNLGFVLRRFKTGTPARVDARSIHFDRMAPQPGDDPITPFSFLTDKKLENRSLCYLTWTNERTHEIIRANLHRAPLYTGAIHGTGARYCPSIEDKVMRFADKDRHQIFLEPEGLESFEWYVQGMSSSLPEEVQIAMYRTVPGLEDAVLMRLAYAIEYDCIDPQTLKPSLESMQVPGLFFAGQINGSSGYEEAAGQGILAGINAALYLRGDAPLPLGRDEAYIGVLVDDLTIKGTPEPYRMMTSRAEYRLLLRQDNADLRLTERGYRIGLVSEARYQRMLDKRARVSGALEGLRRAHAAPGPSLDAWLAEREQPPLQGSVRLYDLLKRPGIDYAALRNLEPDLPPLPPSVEEQVNIVVRYEGYLDKQCQEVERFRALEDRLLPEDVNYKALPGLRIEAAQKLQALRPQSLGQAGRISGVSPADLAVLLVHLEKRRRQAAETEGMPHVL